MTAGVIATSDPRASRIGGQALADGGNALDAAVTAAFALIVLEPHACGLGGDAFVLVKDGTAPPQALDGSGNVPAGLVGAAAAGDFPGVPMTGPQTFTTPGAVDLFATALVRWGTFDLERAVVPALEMARGGYEVRPTLAAACARTATHLAADAVLSRLYLPEGRPLEPGELVRNENLADALELLARRGARDLYEGDLARAVAERSSQVGGYLGLDDLVAQHTKPIRPISTTFRGSEVWELPPPTQGVAVLTALERLERVETFKWDAIVDAIVEGMLVTGVDLRRPERVVGGDTTYIAAIDDTGFGVSLITSVFSDFGSVVGVEALGGPIQNRASGISLVGQHPRPGRPPHTTIPALVTRKGELSHVLGVVGGYMQAQGQVQVLVNLLVKGMAPQDAIDAPRFRVVSGGELAVEPEHELAMRFPEAVGREPGTGGFGGGQVVSLEAGRLAGGADRRRGGLVVEVPA